MFTGLIEDIGAVRRMDRKSDSVVLVISSKGIPTSELSLGESVAVNGVCLTVTHFNSDTFSVLAGGETLRRTTLGDLRVSSKVNLERAMQVGGRLGGHMVSGHVDGIGTIAAKRDLGANLEFTFRITKEIQRYVVEKGSITIDGISLTVNQVGDYSFAVALIPHTVDMTTLGEKNVGSRVNLEVDIIGKYVEKLLGGYLPS